ncbi:unnamed protein product [Macrosiphum euphorbiae]|uniref:Uncharacterized protein n=1 Tax=Macrosiphum euphorbiae TaxID=13131 RepID=A0AAV0Y2I9_9HEMI|nr:unnamed protein product [Macrosiphum euphorbiae]
MYCILGIDKSEIVTEHKYTYYGKGFYQSQQLQFTLTPSSHFNQTTTKTEDPKKPQEYSTNERRHRFRSAAFKCPDRRTTTGTIP